MKKVLPLIIIVLLLPFLISQKPPKNGEKPYVDGQVMVKLRSDVSRAEQDMALKAFLADFSHFELRLEEKLSARLNILLLNFNPERISDKRLLDDLRAYPGVEMAQFNHFIERREYIPSDQYFGLQWNMHNTGQTGGTADADIDAPEAWEIASSNITATGDEIVIANVDDGFDIDHEDLEFWKNTLEIPNNNIDDDTNGYVDDYDGWNSWSNSGVIIERDHGTHTTGIAAAQGDNDKGVAGVNLHVKVLPVVGSATVESIVVAAYSYLYEMRASYNESNGERGAFIVSNNCSFGVNMGQPEDYPIWGAMYDSLGMLGILSAGATANANWNIDEVGDIPTAFPSEWLITVTNTDEDDNKNSGAAYGATTIDLGAPGTQIYSTRQGNQYGYKTGCSMSAPHIAGAIAFLYSVADESFMQSYHQDPGNMALIIRQCILQGVDTVPSLMGITVTGGRLNLYKAAMLMPSSVFSVDILAEKDSICNGESLQLTANVNGGTGDLTYSWTTDPAGFISSDTSVTVAPTVTTTYYLDVLDGEGIAVSDTILVFVSQLPDKPYITSGPASVDNFSSTFSYYYCSESTNAVSYIWSVTPSEAGTCASTGTEGKVLWSNNFTGIATISVVGFNECGTSGDPEAFTTEVYSSASVTEYPNNAMLSIFPNPAREGLSFKVLGLSSGMNYKIGIYNSAGMMVFSRELKKDGDELIMDVSSLPKGIYLVTLNAGEDLIETKKIIIN